MSNTNQPLWGDQYPRDLLGYGQSVPNPQWPNKARVAVQFVLNYEEGGENCVLHGDSHSEVFLSEIIGAAAYPARHISMESLYDYGARVGVWRILRLFESFNLPITIFGVAMALQRHPKLVDYLVSNSYDVCCHGYRWISYQEAPKEVEREHVAKAIEVMQEYFGQDYPIGWYTGRNSVNTRELIQETGQVYYDSDEYNDDLPYWVDNPFNKSPHLVIPYTLDVNDMRFATNQGFNSGEQFFQYLKDSFDYLYMEGESQPKMMSVGMHCRLLGRPGRLMAMKRFLEYIAQFPDIWVCTRRQIADHWHQNFQPNN